MGHQTMQSGAVCMCDWPEECDGSGMLTCNGCGDDQCYCRCGGECECPGCAQCMHDDWGDYPDDDDGLRQAA